MEEVSHGCTHYLGVIKVGTARKQDNALGIHGPCGTDHGSDISRIMDFVKNQDQPPFRMDRFKAPFLKADQSGQRLGLFRCRQFFHDVPSHFIIGNV